MQLFLDCDGVLADFERGAHELLGMPAEAYQDRYGPGGFWKRIASAPEFYTRLHLLPDAMDLFEAVRGVDPIILTGLPVGKWAEPQKRAWVEQHFPGVQLITTLARHKSRYCEAGDVLVDDREKYRGEWEQAGGVFVHHTDAQRSLQQLRQLGIIG